MYNGAKSQRKIVTCGVPEGSILGDFLYNIFYNNDTCLYLSGRDHCALINLMNTESKLMLHWHANRLTLNTCKTFFMVFHRVKRRYLGNIGLYIDDIEIKETPTMKYLRE